MNKNKKYKKLKELVTADWQEHTKEKANPLFAALENPDILSEYSRLHPYRDIDEEEEKERLLKLMQQGYATLSPRERQVIDGIKEGKTQEEIAKVLRIKRNSVKILYLRAQKKLKHFVTNSLDSDY